MEHLEGLILVVAVVVELVEKQEEIQCPTKVKVSVKEEMEDRVLRLRDIK
jgi:hypothetical protein